MQQFHTIHHRHHQVADNKIYIVSFQRPKRFLSVGSLYHIIILAQDRAGIIAHVLVVFYHQHRQPAVTHQFGMYLFGFCHCRPGLLSTHHRQQDTEGRTTRRPVLRSYLARKQQDQLPAQIQPDARSALPAHRYLILVIRLIKTVENTVDVFLGDSFPCIAYANKQLLAVF